LQRLREQGVAGGYAIVTTYVRPVRPTRQPAFLTLAFAPGECAPVDWGSFGSVPVGQTRRRRSVFVIVLCYSRMMSVECTVSQPMAHFVACHHHALAFFGGLPHKIMVDNLKSAVLTRAVGAAPVCTPTYLDLAHHSGFPIAPCHGGTGKAKGRVANGVGYVKKHFLAGLASPALSALNPAARPWLDTGAKVRRHSDTREPPVPAWHTERPALSRLPLHPCEIATVSPGRASRPWRLPLDTNRYAVPAHYAGQALTLKTDPDRLCVYLGEALVARHARQYDRFQDIDDPAHPKPLLEQRQKARDHQRFRRLLTLSPQAEASYRTREERRLNPHHHVRQIVALRDISTPAAGARGLEDALVSEAFSSAYIAHLLAQRARFTPEASALHLPRRADLLAVRLAPPALSIYQATRSPERHDP
jgi:transposase